MNDQEFWDGMERLQVHVKKGNSVGSFIKDKPPVMRSERCQKIVQFLAKKPNVTTSEIADETGIIKRSVHRDVVVLEREGVVEIHRSNVNKICLTAKYRQRAW